MELLVGKTVRELVAEGLSGSLSAIVDIGRGLAEALTAVHEAGVIHRDVKASNVFVVDGDGPLQQRVRLIDFGTVHANEESAARTMLIENDSTEPLKIDSIDLITHDKQDLHLREGGCTKGDALKPGESCPITILWEPRSGGLSPEEAKAKGLSAP